MTGGFSFPPPPPPPPKATSTTQPEGTAYEPTRGGRGGRGGRGRGGSRGRGGQQQRGGRQQQHDYHSASQNAVTPNGSNYYGNQQGFNKPAVLPQPYSIPPGSYVNPAFGNMHAQPQDSAQYAQPQFYNTGPYQDSHVVSSSSSYSQKRNRDQAFGQSHKHPMKKPTSVSKIQAAPAVPSFGAPFLPPKPTTDALVSRPTANATAPKKQLGLIPQDYDSEESEHEVDEEAAFANLQNGPLSFEFNGELSTLNSSADIASWIEERKKRWPSKQRIEEKKQEVQSRMQERRRIEEETRAAAASSSNGPASSNRVEPPKHRQKQQKIRPQVPDLQEPHTHESKTTKPTLEETRRELEKQMQKVQELQRRLAESESKAAAAAGTDAKKKVLQKSDPVIESEKHIGNTIKEKDVTESLLAALEKTPSGLSPSNTGLHPTRFGLVREIETLQADNGSVQKTEYNDSIHGPADVVAKGASDSESDSSSDSSSSDSESDSDGAPEEASSKTDKPPRVPPPASAQRVCSAFANTGRCKFGAKCRYRHVHDGTGPQPHGPRESGTSKRKSLYQRMVEQEQEEENKLALQAIKHLGSVGFFSKR